MGSIDTNPVIKQVYFREKEERREAGRWAYSHFGPIVMASQTQLRGMC